MYLNNFWNKWHKIAAEKFAQPQEQFPTSVRNQEIIFSRRSVLCRVMETMETLVVGLFLEFFFQFCFVGENNEWNRSLKHTQLRASFNKSYSDKHFVAKQAIVEFSTWFEL